MRETIIKKRLVCALFAIVFASFACRKQASDLKIITSEELSEGKVVLKSATGNITKGANDLIVEFRDTKNNLLPVERARILALMLRPGTPPVTAASILLPTGTKGRFSTRLNLTTSDKWLFSVEYALPGGPNSTSFTVDVR